MSNDKSSFDWNLIVKGEAPVGELFDERLLYREMRREKLLKNFGYPQQKYSITLEYDDSIDEDMYRAILKRYFGIPDEKMVVCLNKLKRKLNIRWENLSGSVAELLVSEIKDFLSDNGLSSYIISKEICDHAIKKPGNNIT